MEHRAIRTNDGLRDLQLLLIPLVNGLLHHQFQNLLSNHIKANTDTVSW